MTMARDRYGVVLLCRAQMMALPELEYRFHGTRRWRFDYCWPDFRVALEVDGGGFVNGRHSRGLGMEKDNEKMAEAALMGWRVIRVTPKQVKSGQALEWVNGLMTRRIARETW